MKNQGINMTLSAVLPATGTPVLATFTSGLAAAVAALLIRLEVLVEMMSIGTLLAYTLVSTCVLILRYQPHSTNLIGLLPESLRTPIKGSPTKENLTNGQVSYGNQLAPDMLRSALGSVTQPPPPIPGPPSSQRVMVRRVTRSSPDSDDTFPGEESEDVSMRDDQFLVADCSENKFYGSVRGGSTPAAAGPSAAIGNIGRRLQAFTYLCPAIFPWVDTGPATAESGMFVMKMVGLLYLLILGLDLTIVLAMGSDSSLVNWLIFFLLAAIIAVLLVISRKPQNRKTLVFMTPGLPFVPAIAVVVNIYLIFKLSILTLVRFTLWMIIGFGVYFYYGIKHSSLEGGEDDHNIELTVTTETGRVPEHHQPPSQPQVQQQPELPSQPKQQPVWDPQLEAQPNSNSLNVQAKNPLFVSTSQFPKWDD